jgi:hypothetical protein
MEAGVAGHFGQKSTSINTSRNPKQEDKRRQISLRVTPEQLRRLRYLAAETDRSLQDLIVTELERLLADHGL